MVEVFEGEAAVDGFIPGGGMMAAVADFRLGEMMGAAGVAAGDSKSVGRLRRIVLVALFSAADGADIEVATPMAESREMREVLDFAACTVAAI